MPAMQTNFTHPEPFPRSDGPGPRKRRKRAPAAGAANDCFTCTNSHVQCDRRRPYCSQCLDAGRDCAGYKTQLTWGVGVASRGKLRGLSLPIAGAQKSNTQVSVKKKRSGGSPFQTPTGSVTSSVSPFTPPVRENSRATPDSQCGQAGSSAAAATPASHGASAWSHSSMQHASHADVSGNLFPGTVETQHDIRKSSAIHTSYQDEKIHSSINHPLPVPDSRHHFSSITYSPIPANTSSGGMLATTVSDVSQTVSHYSQPPHQESSISQILPDHHHYQVYPRVNDSFVRHESLDTSPAYAHNQWSNPVSHVQIQSNQYNEGDVEEVQRQDYYECAVSDDSSAGSSPLTLDYRLILSPFATASGIGKTPRMQYLINYYTEVISPVIVAFDGPNNPYRTQILRLAAESETLQHAISALSASNLRQRRETGGMSTGKTDPARRSSMAHKSLTDEAWHRMGVLSPQEQAREETYHKGWAISTLNKQLAHPIMRKQDSILATLLILCLFHICDSGIAKFQTQFAGVKKLLSLRGSELGLNTPETKWFTRMFTWFDAMTAAVNDREGQLQGHHLEISALSDEEWALENLAGCDGQLFKTVAKLGRLNVLSQGKSVESSPMIVPSPLPVPPFMNMEHGNFDGNGWMQIVQDENFFCQKTADSHIQVQFWREWREIRHALQTWQLNQNIYDTNSSDGPPLTPEQRIDLGNISESFRYSALLYTERIAYPLAASSDPNIQQWVRQSLNYIKQVKSDVYLLWPLFITGSECVLDEDRSIIRERCLDIQKDSGFLNNKSCFELIEKVWLANPGGHAVNMNGELLNGFRFSEIMKLEGNEGEYIVV